jgi:hypothetical protein
MVDFKKYKYPLVEYKSPWEDIIPLRNKRPRDLTDQEAFDLMMYLVELGDLKLFDKIITDKSGNIISHRPGQQTRIVPVISGMPFLKAQPINPGANGSLGAVQQRYFAPTPAFAIVLYNLANFLSSGWKATQIVYGGIGAGGHPGVTDCHSTGHCVDFYGARTNRGEFDVRRDWWRRPVYDSDGDLHASDGFDNWKDETKTFYRLAFSPKPEDQVPAEFFADIYQFAHEQTRAEGFDIDPRQFRAGWLLSMGYIFHPDYPAKRHPGREGHNDHKIGRAHV